MKVLFSTIALALFAQNAEASSGHRCTISLLQQSDTQDESSGYRVYPDQSPLMFDLGPNEERRIYVKIEGLAPPGYRGRYVIEEAKNEAESHFFVGFSKKYFDGEKSLGDGVYNVAIGEGGQNNAISITGGDFTRTSYLFHFHGNEKAIAVLTCTEKD